jgi:hypothetical protein
MRKNSFAPIAILLAVLSSSFIHNNSAKSKSLTYRFVFTGDVTCESDITEKTTNGNAYKLWQLNYPASISCNQAAQQISCTIDVDEKYTHLGVYQIELNSVDPDGIGSKIAFPMSATASFSSGCWTYYMVTPTIEISGQIDVHNAVLE